MIISTVHYLKEILEAQTPESRRVAEQQATRAIRTVVPTWYAGDDETEDSLVCVHPDNGETYIVDLQDCNGSNSISARLSEESALELRLDDLSSDFSDTCLIAVFKDCPLEQCVFFVSAAFQYDWEA
jgi:hypothetical protein